MAPAAARAVAPAAAHAAPSPQPARERSSTASLQRPEPRHSTAQEKLVEEFNFLKIQAVEPLAQFMEYIT